MHLIITPTPTLPARGREEEAARYPEISIFEQQRAKSEPPEARRAVAGSAIGMANSVMPIVVRAARQNNSPREAYKLPRANPFIQRYAPPSPTRGEGRG